MYSSGNHDWHYEGLPGSSEALRTEWREKSLLPLYGGRNPSHWYEDTPCGLRFIGIDNSTYQVSDAQLEFFLEQVNNPAPIVLLVHIPLFLPELQDALYSGRGSHRNGNTLLILVADNRINDHSQSAFAEHSLYNCECTLTAAGGGVSLCGDPRWGADFDDGFETEQREQWSSAGNLPSTTAFLGAVRSCTNLVRRCDTTYGSLSTTQSSQNLYDFGGAPDVRLRFYRSQC